MSETQGERLIRTLTSGFFFICGTVLVTNDGWLAVVLGVSFILIGLRGMLSNL